MGRFYKRETLNYQIRRTGKGCSRHDPIQVFFKRRSRAVHILPNTEIIIYIRHLQAVILRGKSPVSLSMKNGWKDEEDRVYIIYAITDICEQLGCGRQKAFKLLAELDMETGIGLIERKRRGLGKENLIYVKSFVINEEKNQKALSSGEASFIGDLSGTEDSEEPVHTEDTDLHALKEGKSQKYENHTSGNMSTETDDYVADKKEDSVFQKYENHTRSMKIILLEV